MKIVCLIQANPPLIYFVNRINSKYPITEVIVENPGLSPRRKDSLLDILLKIKKHGFRESLEIGRNRFFQKESDVADCNACFKDQWRALDKSIPRLDTYNINSDAVNNRVKEIKPDLILDHGTSIVKDHILENADLALNLHWGLSPYYRGTICTKWAMVNWDPYNIGVTIHKLTKEIDGGDVFAQSRAEIKPGDTSHSVDMQLTYLGTELVLKAIDKLDRGEDLNFEKQDFSLGYLTYRRQWNPILDKQIRYIEENNLVEKMLKHPSRNDRLPIISIE